MKDRRKRKLIMYGLMIALMATTVAYAVLQTTLNINGTVTKKGGSWNIYFTNLSTPSKANGTLTGEASVSEPNLSATSFTFNATLVKPLDSIVYTFDVVNDGTIHAMLDSIALTGVEEAKEKDITYTLTYADGKEITEGDILASEQSKSLKLTLSYDDVETLDSEDTTLNVGATLVYVQASDTVVNNSASDRQRVAELAYADWYSDYNNGLTTKTAIEYIRDYLDERNIQSDDVVIRENGEILVGVSELPAGFQVGDYVAYKYNAATYTTPTGAGRVNTTTQTFSSASNGNVDVPLWRVLSIDDYVVELVAVMPSDSEKLVLYGQEGYLNGPTVLNDMAETLYSSEYGTARSIDMDDIYKYYDHDGTREYLNASGTKVKIASTETGLDTIGQIMAANGLDVSILGNVVPGQPNGSLANLKYNYPSGNVDAYGFDFYVSNNEPYYTERAVLFANTEPDFWVAGTTEYLRINRNTVTYRHFFIDVWEPGRWTGGDGGSVSSRNLCSSQGDIETDVLETPYNVRPIVELKPQVKFSTTKTTVNGQEAWTIVG